MLMQLPIEKGTFLWRMSEVGLMTTEGMLAGLRRAAGDHHVQNRFSRHSGLNAPAPAESRAHSRPTRAGHSRRAS